MFHPTKFDDFLLVVSLLNNWALWDLSFKIKFIKVARVSQIELAMESLACVQILQISLYKTISTGKSEHAS